MALQEKYINPLTDFGFKKLFGTESNKDLLIDFLNQLLPAHHQIELPKFTKKVEELETHFEKWLFVLKWLNRLQNRPRALQERVFQKLFKLAEIAKYNKMERAQYEQSLKQYRDLRNVVKFAEEEGIEKGMEKKTLSVIKMCLEEKLSLEMIAKLTRLSIDEVKKIIEEQGWEI